MGSLADIFLTVRPNLDKFPAELKTKASQGVAPAGKEVGKNFGGGIMSGIGAAVAAAGVVTFFKGAFDEAQEAAKVTRLTEAALKSTGNQAHVTEDQIGDLATRLSDLAGVDDEVIQSSENVLLTFTKVRNEAGKGNDIFNQGEEAALNLSAALGTDLQASVLLVGKALNDPISGLTALKKAGIQLTDQQKESIKTFVATGDIMSAQKIILGELTTQFGGAAEAAASPADKARVAWGNFQESVGNKLLPMLNEILNFGLRNQAWLVPLAQAVAGLGVVIAGVVAATKAWEGVNSLLGIGLEGTAVKAKRAALGISAVLLAVQAVGASMHKDLNPQINALSDDLIYFAQTGKLSGEMLRIVGGDAGDLDRTLGESRGIFKFTDGLADMAAGLVGQTGPAAEAREKIAALDTALAQLAGGGHADAAADAFNRLWLQAQAEDVTLDELRAKFPEYVAAAAAAAKGTGKLAEATKEATDEGESMLDVWNRLNGTMLTADEAMLDAQHAIEDVSDAFKEGGKSIAGNSVAALENRISLEKAAKAAADAATQYLAQGGTAAGAAKIMSDFEAAAIKATGATGKNKDAVKQLADSLFSIPKNVTSNIDVKANLSVVLRTSIQQVQNKLNQLALADGGIVRFFAGGGFEEHVAQIVKAGTIRVFGEQETGGEAYIPLSPAKRLRSTAILADVAGRFGYSLTGAAGGTERLATAAVAPVVTSGGTGRLEALLVKLIEAVERIAPGVGQQLNGSVGVMRVLARSA